MQDTLALTVDAIATDDTVNLAEKAAGFAISGTTGSEGGVSVTVTVGSMELSDTSDNNGAWSVTVPANATYITGDQRGGVGEREQDRVHRAERRDPHPERWTSPRPR